MVSSQQIDLFSQVKDELIAIDESVGGRSCNPIDQCIESMLLWAHNELGSEQFVKAKEQFYWKTGKVFSDDIFYSNRIGYFVDHFLFERPIETNSEYIGQTPFQIYSECQDKLPIVDAYHSLFTVTKVTDSTLQVKDLIGKTKLSLSGLPAIKFDGIDKSDIFQGFIYKIEDKSYLSRGIVFHPYKAFKIIKKNLKSFAKSDDFQANLFLYQLARQQLKQHRHEHVDPRKFYSDHQS